MIQSVKIPTAYEQLRIQVITSHKNSQGGRTLPDENFEMAARMLLLATVLMALVTYDHSGAPQG